MLSATIVSTSPVSRKVKRKVKRSQTKKAEDDPSNIPQELVDGFKSISSASNSEEITNCEARVKNVGKKYRSINQKARGMRGRYVT